MAIRAMLLLALLVALSGCGLASSPQGNAGSGNAEKAANEGLSRKEERELSKRLEELEKKVEEDSQETTSQPEEQTIQEPSIDEDQTEAALLAAVENYYRAIDREDWSYTYDNLDSVSKAPVTEQEWVLKNQWLADQDDLELATIDMEAFMEPGGEEAQLTVERVFTDGSSFSEGTVFVFEDGKWVQHLTQDENDILMPDATYEEFVASRQEGSPGIASATATATATASPSAAPEEQETGTKQVKVVVTSDVPVDVTITDDNFDVSIAEEINGAKTYEFDMQSDSGLLVDAMNMDMDSMSGNVSIEVYENGKLKTQDSDSTGYAQVMY